MASSAVQKDLFRRLPGELLIHILKFVLVPEAPEQETLASYAARATPFRLVSLRFNAAVEAIAGIHAHAFPGPYMRPMHVACISGHPTPHSSLNAHHRYWSYFLPPQRDRQRHQFAQSMLRYLTIARLPSLRSVSIDFVIPSLKRKRSESTSPYDESLIIPALERMSAASHSIEHAYIRLPPSQRCIDLVQSIIAKNCGLQSFCIEVDSSIPNGNVKPKFRLNNFTLAHVRYAPLQRFVLRAPSCDVDFILAPHRQSPFFTRLADVKEFGLICYSFATTLPNWYWVYVLFRSSSALVFCDIAFAMPDEHHVPRSKTRVRRFRMPHLQQLSIHIPEVDTHLLRRMQAPFLYTLRLRSSVHIAQWPICDEEHFPSLFIVNIICPGPAGPRMEALGIAFDNYNHNFGAGHHYHQAHRDDFLAYIKPYDRARPKPPSSPYPALFFRRLPAPSIPPSTPPPPSAVAGVPSTISPTSSDSDQEPSSSFSSRNCLTSA
ncbi:hypothetical protein OC834_005619 [Tilletia horrida]|nr:hypothetical protein OC834_005619 [Tilletia horrida]